VLGLYVAEIFYEGTLSTDGLQWVRLYNTTPNPIDLSLYSLGAGHASYVETTVQLSGTIAPSSCFVVGGPQSVFDNGYPTYNQFVHITPNIPLGGSNGAGVGVFGVPASRLDATTVPVDSVVWGATNGGHLLARDGSDAKSAMTSDVYPGDSLMRLGASWVDEYPPVPSSCGQ
jgi:hypothetical protein